MFSSLPAEFSVLMTLLSSEDEVLVGNAALCLGNCMEVPQVASTLLKTDIVQVLLKLAGSDAQKTAVQLNAGIALGKLCTAEPRYAGVALSSTFQNKPARASQGQPGRHAVAETLPHRTLWGAWESCCLPQRQVLDPSSASWEEAYFLRELGSPRAPSKREDFYLTGICSMRSLPLSSLHSTSSFSILLSSSFPSSLLPIPPLLCPSFSLLYFSRKS